MLDDDSGDAFVSSANSEQLPTWQEKMDELKAALVQARPLVEFVAKGHREVANTDILRFPDLTARRVLAEIEEALS